MSGEQLSIGDFGHIVFNFIKRHYYNDKEGKLRYSTVKELNDMEGMSIIDADKSRIFIEGLDNDNIEIFNIRRSQVISFEKMERPQDMTNIIVKSE